MGGDSHPLVTRTGSLSLDQAYLDTTYQIVGHCRRTVAVLKQALEVVASDRRADTYGQGEIIESFQQKVANYLGKDSAIFFPSGTMAQQIALRVWCDRAKIPRVAYHPLCHLEIHEEGGLQQLHHIEAILLGAPDRLITVADVQDFQTSVAALLLELPQRELGGLVPEWTDLNDMIDVGRKQGIKMHLDGARLYETLPYYQKSASQVASLFDSVYVSFYKGIGGVAGAVLAGPDDFVREAKVWKRRYGGDLISLYPYILAADYYFDRRIGKMPQYHQEAKDLAASFNQYDNMATRPLVPATNMFHVYLDYSKEWVERALVNMYAKSGVGFTTRVTPRGDQTCSFEVSVGDNYEEIPPHRLQESLRVFFEELSRAGLDLHR